MVNFETWTRNIKGNKKESTLDHIYTDNATNVNEVTFKVPTFGDHYLIIAQLNVNTEKTVESCLNQNLSNYSPQELVTNIRMIPLQNGPVQAQWNAIEHSLITVTDIVAPLVEIRNTSRSNPGLVGASTKRMCNRCKYLLKLSRLKKDGRHAVEIRDLNKNIRLYFAEKEKLLSNVQQMVPRATSGEWWDWQRIKIWTPFLLTLDGKIVNPREVAGAFAKHFSDKVKSYFL